METIIETMLNGFCGLVIAGLFIAAAALHGTNRKDTDQ